MAWAYLPEEKKMDSCKLINETSTTTSLSILGYGKQRDKLVIEFDTINKIDARVEGNQIVLTFGDEHLPLVLTLEIEADSIGPILYPSHIRTYSRPPQKII